MRSCDFNVRCLACSSCHSISNITPPTAPIFFPLYGLTISLHTQSAASPPMRTSSPPIDSPGSSAPSDVGGTSVNVKILLIGNSTVGKTSLLLRLSDGERWTQASATTGLDFHVHRMELKGKKIKLFLWAC